MHNSAGKYFWRAKDAQYQLSRIVQSQTETDQMHYKLSCPDLSPKFKGK